MKLFPYQDEGEAWLAGRRRALLGDGMRCGKSPQGIAACDRIGAVSILVVCPGMARQMWARAWDLWSVFGRPMAVVMEPDDPIEPLGVTIVSMDGSRNDALFAKIMAHRWDVILIDECQFLSHPTSQRTNQVVSASGFASRADRVWFLSGTPMMNHPADLYVVLATIGIFRGKYSAFEDRYCEGYVGEYGFVVTGMKNVAELRAMLDKVMLRRTYYELFPDAPKPTWSTVALDPTVTDPKDIAALAEIESHPRHGRAVKAALTRVAGGEKIDWAAAIPQSNFALLRRLTSAAKAKPVAHWLATRLQSGELDKVVVFGRHSEMIRTITRDLAEFGAAAISGKVKDDARQKNLDDFTNRPDRRVLVLQDSIGRTAIDCSAADALFFAEMDPVPSNNAQGCMRIQGPRQTRPTRIFAGHLPNSTDEQIIKITARKTKMEVELFA